jgi:hypothetical protein
LQKPRLPATTFGRHSSTERYRQSQTTLSSPTVITAHQGACAFAGCRPKNTPARAAVAAKTKRVIVGLHARCRTNTEGPVIICRRHHQPSAHVHYSAKRGHSARRVSASGGNGHRHAIWSVGEPKADILFMPVSACFDAVLQPNIGVKFRNRFRLRSLAKMKACRGAARRERNLRFSIHQG